MKRCNKILTDQSLSQSENNQRLFNCYGDCRQAFLEISAASNRRQRSEGDWESQLQLAVVHSFSCQFVEYSSQVAGACGLINGKGFFWYVANPEHIKQRHALKRESIYAAARCRFAWYGNVCLPYTGFQRVRSGECEAHFILSVLFHSPRATPFPWSNSDRLLYVGQGARGINTATGALRTPRCVNAASLCCLDSEVQS